MAQQQSKLIDVYARVSRLGDRRQRPIAGQVKDCRAALADRGLAVGEVHDQDRGKSAWRTGVRRPSWDRLMERLESGATGGVIVFDMARFSRRPIEGERLIAASERGLIVLDSEGEYDLTAASGRKSFRDALNTAAYESDRLSSRVTRGKKLKAASGEPNVSARPFGFEPDGRTIREPEAEILRDLATRLLAGESVDSLITDLNSRGILTAYGLPWTRAGLRQVLCRDRNGGWIVYKGARVARLDGKPILDEDTLGRVVALFASRRRGRPSSPAYLCSGIAHCGLCHTRLMCRPRSNLKPYPDGGTRREYWCSKQRGGCGRVSADQRGLDLAAAEMAVAILSDRRHAAGIEAAARQAAGEAAKLDEAIAAAEHLAEQLADRLGRGELALARYDAAVKPLDVRLAGLRARRAAIPDAGMVVVDVQASERQWRTRWETGDVEARRGLLRLALGGRRLLVGPADRGDRSNVLRRLTVEP